MLNCRLFNRYVQDKRNNPLIYNLIVQLYSKDSKNDTNNNNGNKKEKNLKSNEALKKLNNLLTQMLEDNNEIKVNKLNLAKPKSNIKNDKFEPDTVSAISEQIEEKVISAAKDVAQSLGGNTKQTESELLSKLLNADSTNNEEEQKKKPLSLSEVISGMRIDRTVKQTVSNEVSRAHQVRQLLDRTTGKQYKDSYEKRSVTRTIRTPKYNPQSESEKINLFGTKQLGIFTIHILEEKEIKHKEKLFLKTWKSLQEKELQLAVTHPPENYFQEMILWTKQGKVWKFPIDNEQGMEEEHNVYFAEHIFLEKHLENWCPLKGPIRHFMELVCVGLSKNPYVTVQAKKDHILWFKDYFLSKRQLLDEIGAMPTNSNKPIEIQQ